eukprot:8941867-Ditylum_brightwellii.AAC.1
MVDNNIWCPVKLCNVPKGAEILNPTLACKLKYNRTKRMRIHGREYEQVDTVHYDNASSHTTMTNKVNVCIVIVSTLMNM